MATTATNKTYGDVSKAILNSAGEVLVTKAGLWTGSCVFTVPPKRWDLVPAPLSVHPYANFLFAESSRVRFTPGLWQVSVEYAGAQYDETEPQYELSPGTGTEPIECHPKFYSDIAGTPSNKLNFSIWRDENGVETDDDQKGEFDRFRLHKLDGEGKAVGLNPYRGITGFISQNATFWIKTWTSKKKPSSEGIHIISNPPGPAPDYGGDTNWLAHPIAYAKRANVYSCTARFQASGPRGWNPVIYPK